MRQHKSASLSNFAYANKKANSSEISTILKTQFGGPARTQRVKLARHILNLYAINQELKAYDVRGLQKLASAGSGRSMRIKYAALKVQQMREKRAFRSLGRAAVSGFNPEQPAQLGAQPDPRLFTSPLREAYGGFPSKPQTPARNPQLNPMGAMRESSPELLKKMQTSQSNPMGASAAAPYGSLINPMGAMRGLSPELLKMMQNSQLRQMMEAPGRTANPPLSQQYPGFDPSKGVY